MWLHGKEVLSGELERGVWWVWKEGVASGEKRVGRGMARYVSILALFILALAAYDDNKAFV